jgi:hypothetical protein
VVSQESLSRPFLPLLTNVLEVETYSEVLEKPVTLSTDAPRPRKKYPVHRSFCGEVGSSLDSRPLRRPEVSGGALRGRAVIG